MNDVIQLGATATLIFPLTDQDNKPLDVSAATVINLIFKKPGGTKVTKAATLVNTGSDGLVKYVTEVGFLDEVKEWRVQGYIEMPSYTGPTQIGTFTVGGNL